MLYESEAISILDLTVESCGGAKYYVIAVWWFQKATTIRFNRIS
jgi:hypothetical protein